MGHCDVLASLFGGVLDALLHLEGRGLVHSDVKLENILVNLGGAHPRMMLCDFGFTSGLFVAVYSTTANF